MPPPATTVEFVELVKRSGVQDPDTLDAYVGRLPSTSPALTTPTCLAQALTDDGLLTRFQAEFLLQGKWQNLIISGKYKLLDRLGSGGMASVFLCEHKVMRRRVALKVLPPNRASDGASLERFLREARAVAQLHHPNIVAAHDVDQDGKLHFLVMEHVDGCSLHQLIQKTGPLNPARAAHYIRQAALGLQHAHEAGLVHRDIKPGNILVDRSGVVKVLDLGLALFFHEEDSITERYDEAVLGTADYLSPEQATDSHHVDIRADIYSLGATFYFLLTGGSPFPGGTVAQKLIWHQVRTPRPVREVRPDVPEEMAAVVEKMMAKDRAQRYQTPAEVAQALTPWTQSAIAVPTADEIPPSSAAAGGRVAGQEDLSSLPFSPVANSFPFQAVQSAPPPSPTLRVDLPIVMPGAAQAPPGSTAMRTTELSGGQHPKETPLPSLSRGRRWWGGRIAAVLAVAAVMAGASLWLALSGQRQEPGRGGPETKEGGEAPTDPPPRQSVKGVAVTRGPNNEWLVQAPRYRAAVGRDGCLARMSVDDVDFFKAGVRFGTQTTRGAYFYDVNGGGKVVELTSIREDQNALTAEGDKGAIRYEFGADAIRCRVANRTDNGMPFYIVLDPAVTAAANGEGEWVRIPFQKGEKHRSWPTTSLFAGPAKLTITGGTRIWGPWPPEAEEYQVWESFLDPQSTREVVLQVGTPSDGEAAKVTELTAPPRGPAPPRAEEVSIRPEKDGLRIQAPGYEATVEKDGCLTSLRVGNAEFLQEHIPRTVEFSRGAYFYDIGGSKDVIRLTDVMSTGTTISARAGRAAIRYEFGPDALTWTAENRTDHKVALFVLFSHAVLGVTDGQDAWAKVPAARPWPVTSWFTDSSKLTITGGNRIWGPWPDGHLKRYQVWEAELAAGETRRIGVKVGAASAAEAAKMFELTGVKPKTDGGGLKVESPCRCQVFQRRSRDGGEIVFRGRAPAGCNRVEARVSGASLQKKPLPDQWQSLPLSPKDGTFGAALPAAAGGWYKVEVRAFRNGEEAARTTVEQVGIGEVFVGTGQSNSTNSGAEQLKAASGRVSSFSGSAWQPADDPQPGVNDGTKGGSCWPAFGDALSEKYGVTIGVASTGRSGSSISEWQPDGELFRWMMARIRQLGPRGFRAVLWHQGEADVGMSAEEYGQKLTRLIEASRREAGWELPWFVAQVSYQNPGKPSSPGTREAQKRLWEKGIALEGPDTDTLTGEHRDHNGQGIHFSGKGLRAHGRMWADKVGVYLEKVLSER